MLRKYDGFTLIELMLMIAIVSILAAIAIIRIGDMIDKAKDATTLGNLGVMRAALAMYMTEHDGQYPSFPPPLNQAAGYCDLLQTALVPAYLQKIPNTIESGHHHKEMNKVGCFWNQLGTADDELNGYGGGWRYDANPHDLGRTGVLGFGSILVLCTHCDAKGRMWSTY